MRQAKINSCDIIHFPEGALSGYAKADFSSFDNFNWNLLWVETDSILALAKELKLWVLLGSAHKLSGRNKPHNSLYVISPEGKIIDRYDKRFCTSGDLNFYSPGDHFTMFEINNVRCGLLICYDLRFPELFREYRKLNADVIFHSFNNSRHAIDCIHPKIMPITAQARAGTNRFYISINNSSAPYGWASQFITPDGLVNGKLEANKPGILISEIDTSIDFYDASRPYRMDAINGKLNSGETVNDPRSINRTEYK
jgi:predicted amidohydrolase